MKVNVYRLEVLIVDFDEVGDRIAAILEDTKYPNHCLSPEVISVESVSYDWTDDSPLNMVDEAIKIPEFRRLFPSSKTKEKE